MKIITLFASGMSQGKRLAENARTIAAYSNEELSIETVTDFAAMTGAGVRHLPAVAVDGRLVCEGRVPSVEELGQWIGGAA